VGDDVVQVAGDALALVGGGPLGVLRPVPPHRLGAVAQRVLQVGPRPQQSPRGGKHAREEQPDPDEVGDRVGVRVGQRADRTAHEGDRRHEPPAPPRRQVAGREGEREHQEQRHVQLVGHGGGLRGDRCESDLGEHERDERPALGDRDAHGQHRERGVDDRPRARVDQQRGLDLHLDPEHEGREQGQPIAVERAQAGHGEAERIRPSGTRRRPQG